MTRADLNAILSVLSLLCMLACAPAQGARKDREIEKALASSFSVPLEDLFKRKHDSELRNLFNGLSVSASVGIPMTRIQSDDPFASPGSGAQGDRSIPTITANASLKYTLLSYWFISTSFVFYEDDSQQNPWNPDFTYCFGYNDWHPYTLSLTYCNYGGNRLNPGPGEKTTNFDQGGWTLGWKFPLPERLAKPLLLDRDATIGCNIGASYVRSYIDAATNEELNNKYRMAVGCKYPLWHYFYFNLTGYYYPDKTQQQPWDPDYTYGFGYFDWHPGTISIQYNNYSGNKWPWNDQVDGTGKFENGSLSVSWGMSF